MKIIFLDIDGVLNLIPQGFDKYGAIFHQHFIDNFRYLIEETGAKIVISSTWRFSGLDTMKSMWEDRNLPGEILSITPSGYWMYKTLKEYKNINKGSDIIRGEEIKYWLENNPKAKNITQYVILDDDIDMLDEQMNNFVKTSENEDHSDYVDIGYGLTKECTEQAIKILNK